MLTEAERRELQEVAGSEGLRRDMRRLAARARGTPPDLDSYIAFATAVARLGNHAARPPRRIRETCMRI